MKRGELVLDMERIAQSHVNRLKSLKLGNALLAESQLNLMSGYQKYQTHGGNHQASTMPWA